MDARRIPRLWCCIAFCLFNVVSSEDVESSNDSSNETSNDFTGGKRSERFLKRFRSSGDESDEKEDDDDDDDDEDDADGEDEEDEEAVSDSSLSSLTSSSSSSSSSSLCRGRVRGWGRRTSNENKSLLRSSFDGQGLLVRGIWRVE